MKIAWFIAWRVAFRSPKTFSNFVVKLSLVATAVSVAVMVLTLALLKGFKTAVEYKVFSFLGHIRVSYFNPADRDFTAPSAPQTNEALQKELARHKEIDFYAAYANKYGVLLSEHSLEGVLFKGYSVHFQPKHFNQFIVSGRWWRCEDSAKPPYEIVISEKQARALQVSVGQSVVASFIQADRTQKKRKLKVVGIYKTGVQDYDQYFTFIPLPLIQKINGWSEYKVGGYDVFLKDAQKITPFTQRLFDNVEDVWQVSGGKEVYPSVFDWLALLDLNQYIVWVIMFLVAAMNMITCMLTLVRERTFMTAILKVLGASDWHIQKIFVYYALFMALVAVLSGNILALGLGFLQNYFGWVSLYENAYFINRLRLVFDPVQMAGLNVLIIILCFGVLLFYGSLTKRQRILQSLQF